MLIIVATGVFVGVSVLIRAVVVVVLVKVIFQQILIILFIHVIFDAVYIGQVVVMIPIQLAIAIVGSRLSPLRDTDLDLFDNANFLVERMPRERLLASV